MSDIINLRKGKSRAILEASVDAALLAVEIYNKPRTTFKSQGYITLMIMAWTRAFHAYFNNRIGDKFYYKKKHKYERIDGEKKLGIYQPALKSILNSTMKPRMTFHILNYHNQLLLI